MRILFVLLAATTLTGCIARTALDIVTLPVKAAGAAVDKMTTSQAEADQKRGREIRKQEEREGKAARERARREEAQRDD